jgi:hypothetical protein
MSDPLPKFPHRHNSDRTHDSICPVCFRTIATQRVEADLLTYELKHLCPESLKPNIRDAIPFTVRSQVKERE